jgi:hypothetical protein
VRGIERFIPELLQGEGDAIWQFRELASRHIAKAGTQVGPPHFEMFLDRIGGTTADAHSDPLGTSRYEVIQFAFECYGFETFHVLVNPSNPLVQTVLTSMVESGEYFFFAFAPNQRMTAFRTEIGDAPLSGLIANLARIQGSTTTELQYQKALTQFRRHPSPPGHVLEWVCCDNPDYLDLTQDRLDMNPRHSCA